MAKIEKNKPKTDYSGLLKALKENGPGRLYLLWGEEDYLRESFFQELKKLCLVEESSDFNHHRLDGAGLSMQRLSEAVDAVPFMGERCLIEVRNFDVNAVKEAEADRLKAIISDIPDYSSLVLLLPTGAEPDGRLGLVKAIKKQGEALEFTLQSQNLLIGWIGRRFSALGKTISPQDCERLIFISGGQMTRLVPEIEKIAGFAKGEQVSKEDIEKTAQRIPEASVFELTDRLSERNYDAAALLLGELLQSGEHPIKLLAMIGFQLRRLYTAKVALEYRLGREFLMKATNINYSFLADKLLKSAAGFSKAQLREAVQLCADCDYRMKSSSADDGEILKELLLRLAAGASLPQGRQR